MDRAIGRSPTFFVGSEQQRQNLDQLQRREQHLAEQYQKNKPLSFVAGAYQKTHPLKAAQGHRDADVTLVSPMLLGVADGVSQIEEYGIDASELPKELLKACEEQASVQLIPDQNGVLEGEYRGPIPMMREAYETTEALGSTTVLLTILDNSTRIHGKLHPMIAVLSIGDCEILILRRLQGLHEKYDTVFHTEMQRIEGNAQCPLQVCRIDERHDEHFDESVALEVIERGSAVHCVSAYEGDIVVMGSDGVFDNLFLDEIVEVINEMLPPGSAAGKFEPTDASILTQAATRIVELCHTKTQVGKDGQYPDAPIGRGGKRDDTCCVVGEVMEWTEAQSEVWSRIRRQRQWQGLLSWPGGGGLHACFENARDVRDKDDFEDVVSRSMYSDGEDNDEQKCCIL
mmetsp:Transcript_127027/g.283110  ORF Transcript_127027/g.283110 Transcript_127027/m.283110 type:complete len:400 (-) Transcript_127027:78-1277(-)